MPSQGGRKSAPVSQRLRSQAERFDFFQAVRLLEREATAPSRPDSDPPRYPVGKDYPPGREVVRFRALPSSSFPAGSISGIEDASSLESADNGAGAPEMTVTFMGLTGPNGVLPRHYTTLLIERIRSKDYALRDFFDLFNHRTISLFYRAWEKYRFPIAYESAKSGERKNDEDLFTRCLYSLLGLGTEGLRGRLEFDDEAFLFYGGYYAHFPRSAVSLEFMLADYFELPVKVEQFVGQWLYLGEDDQSSLPGSDRLQGGNAQLGIDTVVGQRVWGIESKFRIRFGPLGYDQFRRFLPDGDALRPTCQMVRSYVGPEFDFDIQPILKASEVPWCRLGGEEVRRPEVEGDPPACLGWNTWIRAAEFDRDVTDAVFTMEGLP